MACPNCREGVSLSGEPKGTIRADFHGAYYAPGPGDETSKRTVLLLTDAFGFSLKNPMVMADEFSKRLECDVWVPDYFNGRPLIPADKMATPDRAGEKVSMWKWLKLIFVIIPQIPSFISNRPSVVDARLTSFISLIKEKKKYQKIGIVGYCFGGSTSVRMGGTDLVDSIVIAHPGRFSIEQVGAIKVPALWLCAQEDQFFPDAYRNQVEASFAARKEKPNFVEYEFHKYKGTAHGFAARPNLELPEIKEAFEGAFEQTVNWFNKTLA